VADPPSTRDLRPGGTVAEDAAAPRPGELFAGRYLVDAELGRGGFGAVYAARDTLLDRPVALKVLARGARDPETLARFLQEARSAAALASEYVVSVHDIVVGDDGAPFLVMELLRGADLHDELADHGPMPVATAVDLVLQAALGVAHAHARGIVHRDLKPRNLFLARRADGTRLVKVLDFGMARWASSELTASGAAIGTPRYMAPEQLRSSRAVDARADVWSLGVVLYELVTGAPIVDADTPLQFAAQLLVDPHVPLQVRRPTLPDGLARVVDRCLAKDPAARFGDLAVFAAALAEFASDRSRAAGAHRPRPWVRPRGRPRAHRAAPGRGRCDPGHRVGSSTPGLGRRAARLRRGGRCCGVALAARPQRSVGARCVGARGRGRRRSPGGVASDRRRRRRRPDGRAHRRPDRLAHRSDRRSNPSAADRPGPSAPRSAEVAAIRDWCLNNVVATELTFLVPGHAGGRGYICSVIAELGCGGLRRGCATAPVTDRERQACRDVLTGLRAVGACR
jgi:hypothetical protein